MNSVSVDLRLRPIRFAFLVRPNDRERTLQIFRINTCLWGGQFNPIIPYIQRVPPWWEKKGYRFENAKQIVNGYLDFFEPDFVVEAEGGLSDGLGFHKDQILTLRDLLAQDDERSRNQFGLSVHDLYDDLYRTDFQFQRRCPHTIVSARAKRDASQAFVACNFGDFPTQKKLSYFGRNFTEVFDPNPIEVDGNALSTLYSTGYSSALDVGCAKIDVDFHDHRDPTLFILDARQPRDLIDFWNLRATHRNVVAIPAQWISELSAYCQDFILKHYRPLPGNSHGVMIQPTSMFSRSISEEKAKKMFERHLRVNKEGANSTQSWYPPIWREPPEYVVRTVRPTLEAESKKLDLPIEEENPEIRFDPLYPTFARKYGSKVRWANVVRLHHWGSSDQIATIFPCNYKNPTFPNFQRGGDTLISTTEGLVIFPQYRDIYERWELADGTATMIRWFNDNEITAVQSDAGRATQQIIHTMGGFSRIRALASKGVVQLLDQMTRRPVTRSAHFHEFQNKVHTAARKDPLRHREFESLVESGAVELGLELRCSKCRSWSWYSLKSLDYTVVCELCLKSFDFPISSPNSSKLSRWAYRVVGPFALPQYARGGYAAALSIRFFANVLGLSLSTGITWSSGQELELANGNKSEADFILWYQRREIFGTDHPTEVLFGEAKSFGKDAFKDDDIARMKLLAESFPGSILVFSTLKEAKELSRAELERLRKLALWGREYDRIRKKSRAPIIVLTGTELFAPFHLDITWKEKGGRHQQLVEPAWVRTDNLRVFADLTQQLYLNLPPYGSWLQAKWKKRAETKKKKTS